MVWTYDRRQRFTLNQWASPFWGQDFSINHSPEFIDIWHKASFGFKTVRVISWG